MITSGKRIQADGNRPASCTEDSHDATISISEYLRTRYKEGISSNPRRELFKTVLTAGLVPYERRRARALEQHRKPLRLHLGCGSTYLPGWVNIDVARPKRRVDLRWDLRRPLPFSDGSVEAVFSEHFFEHLDLISAFSMMVECRRVAISGGIFRIGVPAFNRYLSSYEGNDAIIQLKRGYCPTSLIAINEIMYFHGHRSCYDFETLSAMLKEAGYCEVHLSAFGEGIIQPSPDSEGRRLETLYVEAIA